MPVLRMNMGECPGNAGDVKTAGYLGIFIDITRIVVINEVVPQSLAKNNPCKHRETDANADSQPTAVHFRRARSLSTEPMDVRPARGE